MELRFDEIVFDRTGQLKLITLIIGIIDMGLIGHGYHRDDSRDKAFLAAVIICAILTLFNIVGTITGRFRPSLSDRVQMIDLIYHGIAAIFLACVDIALLISIIGHGKPRLWERLFALIFGVLNAALYGYIPWRIWKIKDQV